jgi:hypothetical protein
MVFPLPKNKKVTPKTVLSYEGDWKDDMRDGFGIQVYADGRRYEGTWARNAYHGEGILWAPVANGKLRKEYEGNFVHGIRSGHGRCFYDSGDVYEGDCTLDAQRTKNLTAIINYRCILREQAARDGYDHVCGWRILPWYNT